MSSNPYEKYEIVKMHRAAVKNAPYNPRTISDRARAKLKANIKKNGLLDPLIVNKKTMHLVSGHQRLSVLDSLMKTEDYELTIALVDMDDKTEKEQNIFMNNTSVMGEFDSAGIAAMMEDIDWKNTGMEAPDLAAFGIDVAFDRMTEVQAKGESSNLNAIQAMQTKPEPDTEEGDVELDEPATEQIVLEDGRVINPGYTTPKPPDEQTYNGRLKEMQQKYQDESPEMTYFIVSFVNRTAKNDFLAKIGMESDEKYVDGNFLLEFIKQNKSNQ